MALLLIGAGLSVLGWVTAGHLEATEGQAATAAREAAIAERAEDLAQLRADSVTDQRNALAALVLHRCDTGQLADQQLCDAARGIWSRPR